MHVAAVMITFVFINSAQAQVQDGAEVPAVRIAPISPSEASPTAHPQQLVDPVGHLTIKQIDITKHKAVAEAPEGMRFKPGDEFMATVENRQCSLRVFEIRAQVIILDTSTCALEGSLIIGQKLEKSLLSGYSSSSLPPVASPSANGSQSRPGAQPRFAGEGAPAPRSLADLMYLPRQGKGAVGIGLSIADGSASGVIGTESLARVETDTSEYGIAGWVGLTDTLALGFEQDYLASSDSAYLLGPASSDPGSVWKFKSEGLRDPVLYLKARAADQRGDGAIFDVSLGLSPSVQEARSASQGVSGTAGRGGGQMSLAIEMGTKTASYELVGGLSYYKEIDRVIEGVSSKITVDGGERFMGGIGFRYLSGRSFDLRSGFQVARMGEFTESSNGQVTSTTDSHLKYGYQVGFGFHPQDNLSFIFNLSFLGSDDYDVTEGAATYLVDNEKESRFNLVFIFGF